jgi:hypothetical protein
VRVIHKRNTIKIQKVMGVAHEVSARGGSTTIELTTPDKRYTVSGKSICSMEDNFNHKVGNSIALGRALKELEVALSSKVS